MKIKNAQYNCRAGHIQFKKTFIIKKMKKCKVFVQ